MATSKKIAIENEAGFLETIKAMRAAHIWRGTIEERKEKYTAAHNALNELYGRNIELRYIEVNGQYDNIGGASGMSAYVPELNVLVLHRKLSVITFMQLWLRAIGLTPATAAVKSKEIFKTVFPKSAANLIEVNGLMITAEAANNDPNNDDIEQRSSADITAL